MTINIVKHFPRFDTRGMTRIMRDGQVNVDVLGKLYIAARKGRRIDMLTYIKTLVHELTHVKQHLEGRPFGVTLDDKHYFQNMAEHEAKLSEAHTSEAMSRLLDNFTRMRNELEHDFELLDCTRR